MKFLLLPLLITGFFFLYETISQNKGDTESPIKMEAIAFSSEMSVGNQIRVIRESKGFSQSDLASAVGLELHQLQIIETGEATPTRDILILIEEILEEHIILDAN
jgi:ribosome-binding protein aMBF1 (putative translation factor)